MRITRSTPVQHGPIEPPPASLAQEMREILSDLVAEQQGLDQFLQRIDYRKWPTPTPTSGWDIRDQVSYLASAEELAGDVLQQGAAAIKAAMGDHASVEEFAAAGVARGRDIRPQQVIEWWREGRARVVDNLSRLAGTERLPWITGDISARTLATARLADTWAHGLDIHHAIASEPEDTLRLRHVAFLGWKTLPWAFETAAEEYPEPIRVELRAPEYQKWEFGPADSEQVVRGEAGEWCRVVVRRLDVSETSLSATGDIAVRALEVAKALL